MWWWLGLAAVAVAAAVVVAIMLLRRRRGGKTKEPRRVWVQNVDVSASVLEARLETIRARRDVARKAYEETQRGAKRNALNLDLEQQLEAEDALDAHVAQLLQGARKAANRKEPVPNRAVNWWGGRLIEAAYQKLHAAEALIVGLYDWDEVEAEIPEAVARVEAGLGRDDPRRAAALELLYDDPARERTLTETRAELRKAIDVGHSAGDRDHSRLRSFRNTILVAAALIFILVAGFALYVGLNSEKIPLCFTPPNAEEEPATWVCPTGEYAVDPGDSIPSGPTSSQDVIVVLVLGLLGGAFSAAVSIRNLTGTSTPYDVPVALAFLKLPLGALTAIGGLIALQGEFVPGLSELDSPGQILAYALVFGYAQQLLTGLLDRRAEAILSAAPGKDKGTHYPERGVDTVARRNNPRKSAAKTAARPSRRGLVSRTKRNS